MPRARFYFKKLDFLKKREELLRHKTQKSIYELIYYGIWRFKRLKAIS